MSALFVCPATLKWRRVKSARWHPRGPQQFLEVRLAVVAAEGTGMTVKDETVDQ
jgi:hypothetical protein